MSFIICLSVARLLLPTWVLNRHTRVMYSWFLLFWRGWLPSALSCRYLLQHTWATQRLSVYQLHRRLLLSHCR